MSFVDLEDALGPVSEGCVHVVSYFYDGRPDSDVEVQEAVNVHIDDLIRVLKEHIADNEYLDGIEPNDIDVMPNISWMGILNIGGTPAYQKYDFIGNRALVREKLAQWT